MKDEAFTVTEEKNPGASKFIVKGRVNVDTADVLLFKLENALKDGQINIILNMAQVEYLSSIGIRVLLKMYKQALEIGGKFNIERPSENVKNVLGMSALDEMLVK
ncbi:MAG: STAS domain-containing protein [Treponema sp.]|jgi:anti-anti-sigma factor|nr:STAS domain-containing protein [Treponema sp.]